MGVIIEELPLSTTGGQMTHAGQLERLITLDVSQGQHVTQQGQPEPAFQELRMAVGEGVLCLCVLCGLCERALLYNLLLSHGEHVSEAEAKWRPAEPRGD